MNTDAVNQKDSILNMYLSKMLKTIMQHFFDPLMPVDVFFLLSLFNYFLNLFCRFIDISKSSTDHQSMLK